MHLVLFDEEMCTFKELDAPSNLNDMIQLISNTSQISPSS